MSAVRLEACGALFVDDDADFSCSLPLGHAACHSVVVYDFETHSSYIIEWSEVAEEKGAREDAALLGSSLAFLREQSGATVREVAAAVGISARYLADIETGATRHVERVVVARIARVLADFLSGRRSLSHREVLACVA